MGLWGGGTLCGKEIGTGWLEKVNGYMGRLYLMCGGDRDITSGFGEVMGAGGGMLNYTTNTYSGCLSYPYFSLGLS